MPFRVKADVPDGSKFAALAVGGLSHTFGLNGPDIGLGWRVYGCPPYDLEAHIQEWYGKHFLTEYGMSSMSLVMWQSSSAPLVHDGELAELQALVEWAFFGLLMQGIPHFENRVVRVSGGKVDGEIHTRTVGHLPNLHRMAGAEAPVVTEARLRAAIEVVESIREVHGDATRFHAVRQGLRALRRAFASAEQDDRLHQFVRAIDAIAHTRRGSGEKDFKARGAELGVAAPATLSQLYRLRNGSEHHKDPRLLVPEVFALPGFDRPSYRVYQAERLACSTFLRVLTRPSLRACFVDDAAIERFWALTPADRAAVLGPGVDIDGLPWNGGPSPWV